MRKPLVSIKMITYNHEPYIAQAIEGVLMQKTDFPFELVIGEDCSTDGTLAVVLDYQKKYPEIIHVITSSDNVGMKKNSYRTLQACRGKYIAYCEGDDYWHRDDKLQMQVDILNSKQGCSLVYSDYDIKNMVSGDIINSVIGSSGKNILNPNIDDIMLGRAHILTLTVLVRKKIILKVVDADPYLHKSNNFLMGDTQLWAELSIIANIYYIDESLATHNLIEESATQSKNKIKTLRFWKSNEEMALYICNKHNLPKNIVLIHQKLWTRLTLKLAFYENNLNVANEAAKKYGSLSYKNKFWYWGARIKLLGQFFVFLLWVRNTLKKHP